ncbi:MAG: 4Fe-4S ferredoxin, iron-sulpur binding protein [Firmicutes bacterium]|nr:4Fe-4S ferredoxin, iron-sulpur binding protein [Bacillota bacterium]
MFDKIAVFYMTGTGNSFKVALWFAEIAKSLGLSVSLKQVTITKLETTTDMRTLCVFIFPTHGFTAPILILKQIFFLPKASGTSAVILPTRAGTRVKGFCFPGMEGTAGYLAALLLVLKGYKIRGVLGIDMPSNWTALHWGLSPENVEHIISRAESKVKSFAALILRGDTKFNGIISLMLGLMLAPISLMYLVLAQFVLAKLFFASDKCVGCGVCAQYCPKQAIKMTGQDKKRPYWRYSCDSCMACMNYCPHEAIEVSPLLAVFFYYITTVPFISYLISSWSGYYIGKSWIDLMQYITILITVYLVYLISHQFMRFPLVRTLFSKLTHTRYFRRYQAPGVPFAKPDK